MFGRKKKKETGKKPTVAAKAKSPKPLLSPTVAEAARLQEANRRARREADKAFNDFCKGKATAEMVKKADEKSNSLKADYWKYVHSNFTSEEIERALNVASGPKPKGDFISNLEKISRKKQKTVNTKSTGKAKAAKKPKKR